MSDLSMLAVTATQIFCAICGYFIGRIHENERLARRGREKAK